MAGRKPFLVSLAIVFFVVADAKAASFFRHLSTVQVTSDGTFRVGSFARINYVPPADRFVVTFGTVKEKQSGACQGSGYAYKEYNLDMQPTGKAGYFISYASACGAGDSGSTMAGNFYYGAFVQQIPGTPHGWRLVKFDAVTWSLVADTFVALQAPNEGDLDPTVAFIDGQIDVSDQYNATGAWQEGAASHHHFFSTDLQPLGRKVLSDSPHVSGASQIEVAGVHYILSSTSFFDDLVVLEYDMNWNYIGTKELRKQANWPQGVVFDGRFFYVSYLDTTQRTPVTFFPFYPNVHLAAYDRDWNLVEDVAVTNYAVSENKFTGRPWVILHDHRLYVSYDVDSVDPVTHEELLDTQQAMVSIYELTRPPIRRRAVRR